MPLCLTSPIIDRPNGAELRDAYGRLCIRLPVGPRTRGQADRPVFSNSFQVAVGGLQVVTWMVSLLPHN